ncbi:subtilisin-like protease 4 [Lycium ferocissimum]|uniref:subtilisin-like protease 4 n=1 Tax=Lycium ferocissimum TaxID=112874 RepID=UPI002814B5E1|nr:subtilisin-like protease 4 [Lycium ferocissimum]
MTPALVYLSVVSIFFLQPLVIFASHENNKDIYIVHLESPDQAQIFSNFEDLHNWHHSFLPSNTDNSSSSHIVYSYRNVLNGFAARLNPEEVATLKDKEGIISVRPRQFFHAQTTHSTNFLGLHQNSGFWEKSNYGKGIIIGILDSGITPDHPSFHDEGVPPPPAKWKGKCEFNFSACNNKLIGARYFHEFGNGMPLDENGHGTHTLARTGNFVNGANFLGMANGTASGTAPLAHVAMYKVCNATLTCSESDMLAAIDVAIEDGVDVISISIGKNSTNFWSDVVALSAFTAMRKGILVSCAAGNAGPLPGSVVNGAPWLLTVGASTTDRKLRATIRLGDGKEIDGESAFQPKDFSEMMLTLIFPGTNISDWTAALCSAESLKNINVKGKIVLCMSGGKITRTDKGHFVKDAGGAGMILMNGESQGFTILADPHVLPAAHVSYADGLKIGSYINSTLNHLATFLFKGTVIGDDHAPAVAGFSSRGPNLASPGILKPDIIGPGVNILAAWPISIENNMDTKSTFNISSGTSMACPHVSGIATLVKSAHPDWSPAAIKSAIMTTTDLVNCGDKPIEDERGVPADYFATGAGHVNPLRATNPGLIYDIQPEDYVPYLCSLNYSNREVSMIVLRKVNCSSKIPEAELNYPSFSIGLGLEAQTYTRTATNVGEAVSSYTVQIVPPQGVDVKVDPPILNFSELDQKKTYQVTFSRSTTSTINATLVQGYLRWTSSKHFVRSPIIVTLQ